MRTLLKITLLALALAIPGCSIDRAAPAMEAGAAGDLGPGRDHQPPPDRARRDVKPGPDLGPKASCSGGGHGFVFDRVLVPTNSTEAQKYALHYKGKMYNSLGGILALFQSQLPTLSFQSAMDEGVCAGQALHLLCLKAKSLHSDPAATAQTWPSAAACCTKAPCFSNPAGACGSAASAKCFSGASALTPTKGQAARVLPGEIAVGALKLGPGNALLSFPMSGMPGMGKPLLLPLKHATIRGTLAGKRITSGILTGCVSRHDLRTKIVPSLAASLNAVYTSPMVDPKTRELLKTLFDANKDGKITAAELESNPLIKTFLDGDVDVDGDGEMELSVGVGFTAVSANIK